jgi:hypothetical protein
MEEEDKNETYFSVESDCLKKDFLKDKVLIEPLVYSPDMEELRRSM